MKKKRKILCIMLMAMSVMLAMGAVSTYAATQIKETVGMTKSANGLANKSDYYVDEYNANYNGWYSSWDSKQKAIKVDEAYSNKVTQYSGSSSKAFGKTSNSPQGNADGVLLGDGTDKSFIFDTDSNTAGNFGVNYSDYLVYDKTDSNALKSGGYTGFVRIDVKATVTAADKTAKPYKEYTSQMSMYKTLKGGYPKIYTVGLQKAEIKYEYFYHGTNTKYELKTNTTYGDIDVSQAMYFGGQNVVAQYVTEDTKLGFQKYAGTTNVYQDFGAVNISSLNNPENAMGMIYSTTGETVGYVANQQTGSDDIHIGESDGNQKCVTNPEKKES